MSDETVAALEAIRDQALTHKNNAVRGVELANNREQHIYWSATAIEAESLLKALDIILEP